MVQVQGFAFLADDIFEVLFAVECFRLRSRVLAAAVCIVYVVILRVYGE
jgi:hypothetical protein